MTSCADSDGGPGERVGATEADRVSTTGPEEAVSTTGPAPSSDAATSTPPTPASESDPTASPEVDLRIRQDALAGDLLGSHLAQFGGVDIEVGIATLEGGHIRLAEGRSDDLSLRMPEFVPGGPYPRAVVAITTTDTSPDPLAPGDADFRFGIDFWVDPVSADRKLDNGDNMLQRGLASDPSQFKLELDRGRPNCRIAGSAGAVEVRAQEKVVPERWYRAECSRRGDDVVLSVTEFHQGSDPGKSVTTGHGATGTVAWTRPEIPLALGGKLAANGAVIRSATDQFNGRLANPELIIDLP